MSAGPTAAGGRSSLRPRLPRRRGLALAAAALVLALAPPAGPAAAAQVVAIFPSDRLTVADPSLPTGRRVSLPLPACAADASGCDEVRLLNQLDGFSVNPRVTLRFSEAITLDSVERDSVFILPLWAEPLASPVGLDQLVWDPATSTLHARPERALLQGRRYALVVTTDVVDEGGRRLRPAPELLQARDAAGADAALVEAQLRKGLDALGLLPRHVAAVAVFTTQSVTRDLERMRAALVDGQAPPALRFALGAGGARSVYPLAEVAGLELRRQATAPAPGLAEPARLPLALLSDKVRAIAFGSFRAASFLTADRVIPPLRGQAPRVQGEEDVHVTVLLPAGPTPPGGWPVAVFGHGYGGERTLAALLVGETLARNGFATVTMNAVGHGGGAAGTLTVALRGGAAVTLPAGGRGVDLDGDGRITATEGLATRLHGPLAAVGVRDGLRQTVADLMQLVRALREADVDGDGKPDLDGARVYYFGQSLGGIYGTLLMAMEPALRVGALSVPGGPVVEIARQSAAFRARVVEYLRARRPSLMNGEHDFYAFVPLPGEPPVRATFPGSLELQAYFDRVEWLGQSGDAMAYAPYLRQVPLTPAGAKRVLVQMAVGDLTVPNPTTESLLRAGDLHRFTSIYRHDRVAASLPERFRDPHVFLSGWLAFPEVAAVSRAAQEQVARFFLSAGREIARTDPRFELRTPGVARP